MSQIKTPTGSPVQNPTPTPKPQQRPVIMVSGYRGLAESFLSTFRSADSDLSVLVRNPEAVADLKKKFPGALFLIGDVSSRSDCSGWVKSTVEHFGRVDCLINNAAIPGPGGKLHEIEFEDFELAVQVNLVAPAFLSQLVLPHFLKQGTGVILNLSGGGATFPRPNFSAYGATKCAIVRLTETLALEYPNLRFYAISPGALKTPMMEAVAKMGPEKIGKEFFEAKKRLEEGGEDPQKAASLALWLVENRPQGLNGKLISAVWDDYKNLPSVSEAAGWWTLRRVDEVCRKHLA